MVLTHDEKERLIRCIQIIDLQAAAIRDIVGTDWVNISTTRDGYMRAEMYDYIGPARESTNCVVATRIDADSRIWLVGVE